MILIPGPATVARASSGGRPSVMAGPARFIAAKRKRLHAELAGVSQQDELIV